HVADAAAHEQPDDAFRLRRELRVPVQDPSHRRLRAEAVPPQQGAEGESAEAKPGAVQELAAGEGTGELGVARGAGAGGLHRTVTKSLWLSKAWTRRERIAASGSVASRTGSSAAAASQKSRQASCSAASEGRARICRKAVSTKTPRSASGSI